MDAGDLSLLPAINAALNGIATALLLAGRICIARRQVTAHRRLMSSAFAVSCLFLVLYVAHKVASGFESVSYAAEGALKVTYLAILISHIILAMSVPLLAILLIRLARAERLAEHRRLARVAWPIWMYVSGSGVLIYAMLYHWNPNLS